MKTSVCCIVHKHMVSAILGTVEGSVPDDLDFLNIKSFILVFDVLTFESLFSEPSLIRCIVSKLDPELFDTEVACGIL